MSDDTNDSSSRRLRWLVVIAMVLAMIVAGRKVALSAADKEFEERLREADDNRE